MAAADEKQSNNRFEEVDETEKYPLLIRIYGVVGIIAGGIQVVAFILAMLFLPYSSAMLISQNLNHTL